MFELKTISKDGVPEALRRAERYRLLNEPSQTESICLDILAVDPRNQLANIVLLLSITDQFSHEVSGNAKRAREILPRFKNEYERAYYEGIICERQARAVLAHRTPGCKYYGYDWLRAAMAHYEKAEAVRPAGNDDSILRWNTCARTIMRNGRIYKCAI